MTTSNLFWIPYELLLNLYQALLFTWFSHRLLKKGKRPRLSFWLCVILTFFGHSLFLLFDRTSIEIAFSSIWVGLIPASYIAFCHKDHWWNKLLWIIVLFVFLSSGAAFNYYFFSELFGKDFAWFLQPGVERLIITLTYNLLLFGLLFLLVHFFSDLKEDNHTRPEPVLFLVMID